MRLDHVSYVASHDQISDVVNRIGSKIETPFIDGGIHPKFGTRNFTAPLVNGKYIEVVCALEHPATDENPFRKAVKQKELHGGGWLGWVIAVNNIKDIENSLARESVIGIRKKPNGEELKWKQLGVINTFENPDLPFFIEWVSVNHPSQDGDPKAELYLIQVNSNNINNLDSIISQIKPYNFDFEITQSNKRDLGIAYIDFKVANRIVRVD